MKPKPTPSHLELDVRENDLTDTEADVMHDPRVRSLAVEVAVTTTEFIHNAERGESGNARSNRWIVCALAIHDVLGHTSRGVLDDHDPFAGLYSKLLRPRDERLDAVTTTVDALLEERSGRGIETLAMKWRLETPHPGWWSLWGRSAILPIRIFLEDAVAGERHDLVVLVVFLGVGCRTTDANLGAFVRKAEGLDHGFIRFGIALEPAIKASAACAAYRGSCHLEREGEERRGGAGRERRGGGCKG